MHELLGDPRPIWFPLIYVEPDVIQPHSQNEITQYAIPIIDAGCIRPLGA